MSKKKVLLRGVFINRDTNGEGVLKVGTTLIRVSTVMGILYKKWVIIIFKWERIFSLVGSDFVCNSFYIESEVVANTSDNNTIKNQKGSEL